MSVPVPDSYKTTNYASDSDQGEDGILVVDPDMELDHSDSDSDADSEDNFSVTDHEVRDDSLRTKLKSVEESDDEKEEYDSDMGPQGTIDGREAWVIEEIVDEKYESKTRRGRKQKYYQVKWKGDYPLDWLHCSRVRAPELIQQWREKKNAKHQKILTSLVMRVCQLNNQIEVKPEGIASEDNPFKYLFDPTYQKRIKPPRGYQNMLKHIFAEYFQEALIKEKLENKKWHTYVEVLRSEVPKGTKILKPVTAYDIKYNGRGEIEKFKSRVCLNGSETSVDPDETYEAIADTSVVRLLLCLAARYNLGIAHTDIKNFFLQATMPEGKEYYAEIPEGWAENDPKTHVAKVLAPWYGLKEAAKVAGDQLSKLMTDPKVGLTENPWMPKVFFKWKGDDFVCCATHIDDGIWIYTSRELLDETLDTIDKTFEMTRKYEEEVTKVLGMEIDRDRQLGLLKIHQTQYILAKVKELEIKDGRDTRSPGLTKMKIPNPVNPPPKVQATDAEIRKYQKKIGVFMWSLQTDPSAMFTVYRLAKSMLNPQKEDWEGLARLERYKCTNASIGTVFRRAISKEKLKKGTNLDCLTYFADADLAGDVKDSKSTSGYCTHLGESGMFDWKSKKQTCVCQSSCESEVYSSKECTCNAIWLRQGLQEMGFTFTRPTPVCQDNTSAIALCKSDKHHSRTRHFRLHINLLRDNLKKRVTRYPWVPTVHMKGDLFNKAHDPKRHEELMAQNGIYVEPLCRIPQNVEPLRIDGWAETLKQQRAQAAAG